MTEKDALAIHNERMKLLAGFVNAIALGLIGFAVLRPLTDSLTGGLSWAVAGWGIVGLAMHGLSHYILGNIRKQEMP
ncbi:hypothetical protein [Paenirhodobacter populi]|uniref:2TM domain-containing protein n=1 Tax=Paenirhodobacter populi TaxID=2306993 RepID=A0A443J7F4_9RHOB|nr:hypothetical protein [Sinirhodobacter populi]RWR07692.1 hypothetical protein D2T32_11475 [Sinirhodobacter populi]RWR13425.1 hypothetical protein D2T33_06890 [Sinirhodobacter populi]RWR16373.1 hypothetical protein D2T30_21885 [Sinirhodobacter populi]RWR30761.1 hypothetical protein D2T31_07250 [Sinirhodobacter populi]RWR34018.1 hypothetical protein D2T29_03715 [Sinirhodobacter populi]